jgi:hypothetical protein
LSSGRLLLLVMLHLHSLLPQILLVLLDLVLAVQNQIQNQNQNQSQLEIQILGMFQNQNQLEIQILGMFQLQRQVNQILGMFQLQRQVNQILGTFQLQRQVNQRELLIQRPVAQTGRLKSRAKLKMVIQETRGQMCQVKCPQLVNQIQAMRYRKVLKANQKSKVRMDWKIQVKLNRKMAILEKKMVLMQLVKQIRQQK